MTAGLRESFLPAAFAQRFGDLVSTLHAGSETWPNGTPASTTFLLFPGPCPIQEAHIRVKHPNVCATGWDGTPDDGGEDDLDAGLTGPDGRCFRISYLRELLHALGRPQSNTSYSLTSYGNRGWLNRPPAKRIKALPDDVAEIGYLHPNAGARREIRVLRTWWIPDHDSTADPYELCEPSTGSGYAFSSADLCRVEDSTPAGTEVCPGYEILTQVAVANYESTALDFTRRAWPGSSMPAQAIRSARRGSRACGTVLTFLES